MAKRIEAIVRAELLIWARKSMGIDVPAAARKLAIPEERLTEWETGAARPTISKLREMAALYKRPLAVFFLPEVPKDFPVIKDFRGATERGMFSPELNFEIRKAIARRDDVLDLIALTESDTPRRISLAIGLDISAEKAAMQAREFLGVPLADQMKWKTEQALKNWIGVFEKRGILVFQASGVSTDEMRGFSINQDILPVIVLNGRDAQNGRIFSLMHELAHVLLRNDGVCDLSDSNGRTNAAQRVEVYCNDVAGNLLVPREALDAVPAVRDAPHNYEWSREALRGVALAFRVSEEAILRQLLSIGRISREHYSKRRQDLLQFYRMLKKQAQTEKVSARGMAPAVEAVRNNGFMYSDLVLHAYHRQKITLSNVSDLLGLRAKHLGGVEKALNAEHARQMLVGGLA